MARLPKREAYRLVGKRAEDEVAVALRAMFPGEWKGWLAIVVGPAAAVLLAMALVMLWMASR